MRPMGRPIVVLELAADPRVARDVAAGGVFVPGCAVGINEDCELVVRGVGGGELRIDARVVWVDGGRGAGLQLLGCDAAMKQRLAELAGSRGAIAVPVPEPEPEPDDAADDAERRAPGGMHERLRGLTLPQQLKLAHTGEVQERIILERIYGKTVWEPLLRNPRVTPPEVARIARMGALPKPLLELICTNGAWLQIPEIRRALLSNPRLAVDQILRVLRLMPKHEVKIAASTMAYPHAVRDAAKRVLRDAG